MPLEEVQKGIETDGNGLVLWVPAIADVTKPKVTELTAAAVKKLTYGLTEDGFTHTPTETWSDSGRYTLKQTLQRRGKTKDELELKYVYTNSEDDVNRVTLQPGATGFIVHRLGYPNETAIAAGQILDVFPVEAGRQRRVPGTANTEASIAQTFGVTGSIGEFVSVVA